MDISFSTIPGNLKTSIGYGYAGFNMVTSLQRLGHKVPFDDPNCKVQIFFSQPEWYNFHESQYKIGYTPWESTELPDNWVEDMSQCDEIWTPSHWIADCFKQAGVKPAIKVYQHGVDKSWSPKRRKVVGPLRFLHQGEPAPRKGGELAVNAFRAAFGNSKDVHLTIKAHSNSTIRVKDRRGSILGNPQDMYDNVSLYTKEITTEQLVNMYHSHDVMVYPSFGEGFGLIPIQALATGMPTICTGGWAPYVNHLLPSLRLSSTLGDSPWPNMHPGKVFFPDFDHLVECYKTAYEQFDKLSAEAYRQSYLVHLEYDWDRLTEQAFKEIVTKFS